LPQVVNYELPNVPEDYVHRIGRTGRAGANGEAISLVSSDESGLLRDIERVLRRSIPTLPTPVFKIVESASPPPSREGRPAQSHGRHGGHGAQNQHGGARRDGNPERRDSRRPPSSGARTNTGTGSSSGTRSFGQPQRGRFR
jgi:ATP-dependent RNA helicase RhlE